MNEVPHYNAFISYRHHPRDIAVAEAIHKGLEHFHVPSSLRKQGKKIDRIFRDKEELPITSSLTDTITQALRSSDFQIVICSTHLKDSYWVQREIETFLQTHSKDQVLTVIVDGEPYDVIPEILTYRDVVDPATGETFREPLEPLSCDWRLPKRKAMKTELPRLAAVLLGCTYNDLIQRQKQYQMRRLAIGAGVGMAASLALAGYFLYTSIQIQENLNQSLLNQSQYLASTSKDLNDKGDRLTAIALALEGLPSETNERPYSVVAEQALSDALMLYDPTTDIIAVGAYTAEAPVNDFILSDDGALLYILDTRANVTAWNTESFEKLSSFDLQRSYSELFIDGSGNLLTLDGDYGNLLRCFSPQGEELWQVPDISSIALLEDKSTILATNSVYGDAHYLLHLDPATGKTIGDPIAIISYEGCSAVRLKSNSYYADQPYLVTLSDTIDTLAVLDHESRKLTKLVDSEHLIYAQNTLSDGTMLLCLSDGTGMWNGSIYEMTTVSTAGADLYCFNAKGKELWHTKLKNHMYSQTYTLEPVPETESLFVQCGNNLSVLNRKTGEVESQVFSSSYPLYMEVTEPDVAWGFYGDGNIGNFKFAEQQLHTIQYMDAGVVKAIKNHGLYVSRTLSSSITRYATTADKSFTAFDENAGSYISDSLMNEHYLAIDSHETLHFYDLANRRRLWTDESWYVDTDFALTGFSADGTKLYAYSKYDGVRVYDIATGEMTLLPNPEPEVGSPSFGSYPVLHGDILYNAQTIIDYTGNSPTKVELLAWNLTDNTITTQPVVPAELAEDWNIYSTKIRMLYADDTHVLMRMPEGQLYRFDLAEGSNREVLPSVAESPVFMVEQDPYRLIIAVENDVLILDENREVVQTVSLSDLRAVAFHRQEDLLYVLTDDGYIHPVDGDGVIQERIGLSLYSNFFTDIKYPDSMEVPITWANTPDNRLVLGVANMGSVIPRGAQTYSTDIPHLICYHAETDSYICSYDNGLIAYPRLELEEVITRGRETLGSFTLTEDQRTAYGLQN